MKPTLFIATEIRMHVDSNGEIRTLHRSAAYDAWRLYLPVFENIYVIGRVDYDNVSDEGGIVTGPQVQVLSVPYYQGLRQLLLRSPYILQFFSTIGDNQSVFFGRMPEITSFLLFLQAKRLRARFITNVVSDAEQHYAAVIKGVSGQLVSRLMKRVVQVVVRSSIGVIYVTSNWLQGRYPARKNAPTLIRSNVELDSTDFATERMFPAQAEQIGLISVGSMGERHKGFDALLEVVAQLRHASFPVTLTLVGDGVERHRLELLTGQLALTDCVTFVGQVNSKARIFALLDEAHIYVSASRTEGLPRALIEAMARGLPAVATKAGGSSELLPSDMSVEIDDTQAMAEKIVRLMTDPVAYQGNSEANLVVARRIANEADPGRLHWFLTALLSDN